MISTLRRRPAFTLIELLVTMGLIVVLLSLAVAVSNSAAVDSYKLVGSADKISQALITAKSRALRDKAPRGIRFNIGSDGYIREYFYIESGDPWLPDQNATMVGANPNAPQRSQFVVRYQCVPGTTGNFPKAVDNPVQCRAYLILNSAISTGGNASDVQRFNEEISIGDTVYSPDLGAGVLVNAKTVVPNTTLDPAGVPAGFTVYDLGVQSMTNPDLAAGFTNLSAANNAERNRGTFQTTSFGIYRSPRPIVGEPTLILAKNVIVDTYASENVPSTANSSFDVLFAPGGHVMNLSTGLVAMTVRDSFKFTPVIPALPNNWLSDATSGPQNFRAAGEMILVAIYPKTGTVATKPVAEPNTSATGSPYRFARDAINSGI
jgi:prepilin-type N-terminal cleavage/methylation domain-containing protein